MSVHIAWMTYASCVGEDPNLFFSSTPGDRGRLAKAICATCPVVEDCREHAKGERFGVWAGSLKTSKARKGQAPINHGTNGGYRTHQRRGFPPCRACLEAHRAYVNHYAARKRSS